MRPPKTITNLARQFPPSESCGCEICQKFCSRPGWWTVNEARLVVQSVFARRMMLEISPNHKFGVLAPAFKGNEAFIAANQYKSNGCTFFSEHQCELYSSGFMPLECRFCHHDRPGLGQECHLAIENNWRSEEGHSLVQRWCKMTGVWQYLPLYGLANLQKKFSG